MMITVRLFASFRRTRFKEKRIESKPDTKIADLLDDLNIPANEVGILLVNGIHSKPEHEMKENDVIAIFPAIGGG